MARPDARIPLGVEQRDFSSPLTRLNDQAREDQMFERVQSRSDRVADSQIGANNAARERNEYQLASDKLRQEKALLQEVGMNAGAVITLLEDGRNDDAGALLINSIDKLKSIGADTKQAEQWAFLTAADANLGLEFAKEHIEPRMNAINKELMSWEYVKNDEDVIVGQRNKDPNSDDFGKFVPIDMSSQVGGSGEQFAGDPIFDTRTNRIVGISQASKSGPPTNYALDGSKLEMEDDYQVVPNAAFANFSPEMLNTATTAQAANAAAIEGAKQGAVTDGFISRLNAENQADLTQDQKLFEQKREQELAVAKNAAWARITGKDDQVEMLNGLIDEAADSAGILTNGFLGTLTELVWGSPAYDLVAQLETIRANIGFDKLQQMRESSPTGGALGQVSDRENRLLQAVWGNLENSQSPTQFKENLELVREQVGQSWDRVADAYRKDYGEDYWSTEPVNELGSPSTEIDFDAIDALVNQ
jgi:hypothetical protein